MNKRCFCDFTMTGSGICLHSYSRARPLVLSGGKMKNVGLQLRVPQQGRDNLWAPTGRAQLTLSAHKPLLHSLQH